MPCYYHALREITSMSSREVRKSSLANRIFCELPMLYLHTHLSFSMSEPLVSKVSRKSLREGKERGSEERKGS